MVDQALAEKLCGFGLTSKQAKVYASILMSGAVRVGEISEETGLHEQDIYKILPRLEKMGLVLRTITRPVTVEAIPVRKALEGLISEKQNRIYSQKKRMREIIDVTEKKRASFSPIASEERSAVGNFVILRSGSAAYHNRLALVFENARITYDLFVNEDFFVKGIQNLFNEVFPRLAANGARVRIIITAVTVEKDDYLITIIERGNPTPVNLTIKGADDSAGILYGILDYKELWVPLTFSTEMTCLVTDSKNVVRIAQQNFENVWENPKTRTIFQKEDSTNFSKRKRKLLPVDTSSF
jgi:sugar-specific transcriptional regulator TrmB